MEIGDLISGHVGWDSCCSLKAVNANDCGKRIYGSGTETEVLLQDAGNFPSQAGYAVFIQLMCRISSGFVERI